MPRLLKWGILGVCNIVKNIYIFIKNFDNTFLWIQQKRDFSFKIVKIWKWKYLHFIVQMLNLSDYRHVEARNGGKMIIYGVWFDF